MTDLTDPNGHLTFEAVSLRYSDEDSMGHINNVAYAAYFEAGRMALFSELLAGLGDQKFNFVLANVSIDYLQEMRFPGQLKVGGRLLRVGTKSITTGYGAFLDGVCHATATCVNVYFDPETRRSRPFPDAFRSELLKRAPNQ
ncbi:MAG: thioesterase family protein [Pseudomonadota bacterium]